MKILIVDDSKAMRMIVTRTLKQAGFADCTVVEAANGVQALQTLRGGGFDVVLSDWNMPEMNGLELLRAIKAEGVAVRFGFVTSEGTAGMRQQASEAGALFLITKPFTPDGFAATLKPVLAA